MITISINSFISDTLNAVDSVINGFVQSAYQALIQANAIPITLIFTLYVMWLGYRFTYHTLAADMSTITRHLIVMLVIYALIMNWSLYNTFVYNIFTNEPGNIAQLFFNATGQTVSSDSVAQALDNYFSASMTTVKGLIGQMSFENFWYIFYAADVFTIALLLSGYTLALFIYAKTAMAVLLALGPLFITFILWDSTKELFAAWLRQLINFALVPIIASTLLALMLTLINSIVAQIELPVTQINIFSLVSFTGLTFVTFLLLQQVKPICAGLSGGITLASVAQSSALAAKAFQHSTLVTAGKKGAQFGYEAAKKGYTMVMQRRAENRRQAAEAATNKRYEGMV